MVTENDTVKIRWDIQNVHVCNNQANRPHVVVRYQ